MRSRLSSSRMRFAGPPPSLTRDIVQTHVCNECHGVTTDTRLVFHGARTEVEYCVVCHNPGLGDADMTVMTHKIHAGETLSNVAWYYASPKDAAAEIEDHVAFYPQVAVEA